MLPDPHDTIVALATAAGPGRRGIVRLSGGAAFAVAAQLGYASDVVTKRCLVSWAIPLEGLAAPLPCDGYFFPAPHSYTGDNMVELHTRGSAPLLERLVAACLKAGARAAQPGEFTLRAFRSGKLDLTRAEAVLGVIEADGPDELKQALAQLAGGLAQPLSRLREDLLDLLADVEAALDFAADEAPRLPQDALLARLANALAQVTLAQRQIEQRGLAQRTFRVVLAGPPNAGKSSLFNALLGKHAALVSAEPGTTRDYLEASLRLEGAELRLVDTAGLREGGDLLETSAQRLGIGQRARADLILWCGDRDELLALAPAGEARVLQVRTKADLGVAHDQGWITSARTGQGLVELKEELARRVRERPQPALAPSLSRCRQHVHACLAALRRAHALALEDDLPELLALEIRSALDEMGAMVGAVFTDDLLDRIFSRFCIGK